MEENRKGASRRVIRKGNGGAIVRASLWPKEVFLGFRIMGGWREKY